MYHLNTFHLPQNKGGDQRPAGGAYEKPLIGAVKLTKFRL